MRRLMGFVMHGVLLVTLTSSSFAQQDEQTYGIFATQDQYYQFMGDIKREGADNPELMAMVPMINDIVLGQPIGSTGQKYNATNSTLGLLSNANVRKELEMVDDQYEDLKRANEEIQQRAAEQLRELDLSDIKSATAQILAIRDQSENDLQATLLPQQMKRLRQLVAQNQLRRLSLVEILTREPMKSNFAITDRQGDDLKEQEIQIEAELEKQIAELRENARKKLLNVLNSRQQKEVEEWIGESFEFQNESNKSQRKKGKPDWKK